MKQNILDWLAIIGALLFIVGLIAFAASRPYIEAKAFNDCTGGNASYWTAAFTELRVENCKR